jgi:hypothetical protein
VKKAKPFTPTRCECCGQTQEYVVAISKGIVLVLKKFSQHVKSKGVNVVHIEKEMVAPRIITNNQYANVKILTAHGLLAKAKGEAGNYVLTRKGLEFLKGTHPVPKYAIISKVEKRMMGYHDEEFEVHISDFDKDSEFWEGVGYDIKHGRVINEPITSQQ